MQTTRHDVVVVGFRITSQILPKRHVTYTTKIASHMVHKISASEFGCKYKTDNDKVVAPE